MISGRKNWKDELLSKISKDEKYIWIHAASLGEFEQGRPLIEKIKKQNPHEKILLTFFSPSGYDIRKNYQFADIVCYLPFDCKKNAREFIKIINPKKVFFVKYEFWCFYIDELFNKKIPLYLISGIFRKNQLFFKPYGKFYLKRLEKFSFFFLQDENSKKILNNFNINNCIVCGDTRHDRVFQIAKDNYSNEYLEKFSKNKNTIVCGSTWIEDEIILCEIFDKLDNDFNLIIAPHEITEKNISYLEKHFGKNAVKFSEIENAKLDNMKLIIIDSIGILSKIYRYGKFAYVGGGFGKGIHNILEATVYNIPVFFGPKYKKFKEAIDLIDENVAFTFNNKEELLKQIQELSLQEKYDKSKENAKKYFLKSVGATEEIYNRTK